MLFRCQLVLSSYLWLLVVNFSKLESRYLASRSLILPACRKTGFGVYRRGIHGHVLPEGPFADILGAVRDNAYLSSSLCILR